MQTNHPTMVDLRCYLFNKENGIKPVEEGEKAVHEHIEGCSECQERLGFVSSENIQKMKRCFEEFAEARAIIRSADGE